MTVFWNKNKIQNKTGKGLAKWLACIGFLSRKSQIQIWQLALKFFFPRCFLQLHCPMMDNLHIVLICISLAKEGVKDELVQEECNRSPTTLEVLERENLKGNVPEFEPETSSCLVYSGRLSMKRSL